MQFTLDARGDINVVRAYAAGEIRVGERIVRSNCLLAARTLIESWGPQSAQELAAEHLTSVFELEPQLVLLSTGSVHIHPSASVRSAFAARAVGLEAMTLGAACRTYNTRAGGTASRRDALLAMSAGRRKGIWRCGKDEGRSAEDTRGEVSTNQTIIRS